MTHSWSPQQDGALKAIEAWLHPSNRQQVFRLFGYAGSGKTTLAIEAAHIAKRLNPRGLVLFGAFTGKAALVMRRKGCEGAQTIHSMIYKLVSPPFSPPVFALNDEDSPALDASLIILDECSMIGKELGEDLLSFDKKVLVLGDPAQLPPIQGRGFFDSAKPDVMLTEIHRQAADNPIIRMSMDIRTGKGVPVGSYGESRVIRRKDFDNGEYLVADQILCGKNATRRDLNSYLRKRKGFIYQPDFPEPNEKLICLRNNREKGLMNGGLWIVADSHIENSNARMHLYSMDDPRKADVTVPLEFFAGCEANLDAKERRKNDEFDYGYAMTVHKSQGSQWPYVVVYNENQVFREHAARWLYTAVTRAADKLTLII